ncbi:hypothetical protein [Streptomyces sp. NPDC000134]|uniref:hypothetical protein n=1 Tax=Streptomyces sp. NPDC000134 TaxID=3364536 RepID=UPI0036920099
MEERGGGDVPLHDVPPRDVRTSAGAGRTAAVPSSPAPERGPRTVPRAGPEPVLRVLPLGTGLVLMGLGLALAFAGLRLRRGRP